MRGHSPQHCRPEFTKSLRNVFNRTKKHKESEMTTLSKKLVNSSETTETIASIRNNTKDHEICLFSDSPHYIVRV